MRQFASMIIEFSPSENRHLDRCGLCRRRAVDIIKELANTEDVANPEVNSVIN
jgi:hypothetical protein